MLISDLIEELEQFKKWHGDVEMEFSFLRPEEDSIDCVFDKIHDSNLDAKKTCCLYISEET